MGRVVPIFKEGDRFNINNYRPISITCTVCKLLEHIICKYITDYTETNKIFYDKQHEFCRCLSTVTQLFETVQYFALAINNKEGINVIALDFSKAFDRVCHAKLVRKLYDTGLSPKIVRWVQAYLKNRQQLVKIYNERSSTLPVTSGVPQVLVWGRHCF